MKQQLMREALSTIQQGKKGAYGEIASKIRSRTQSRVAAGVCSQNKIDGFIHCHQVIGKSNIADIDGGLFEKRIAGIREKGRGGYTVHSVLLDKVKQKGGLNHYFFSSR